MDKNLHTAIVLFSNTYTKELENKPLFQNKEVNQTIYKTLFKQTLKTVRNSNKEYFIESSLTQTGKNFGEKIANSFEKFFHKGYSNVIIIGTDTVGLSVEHLNLAADKINCNQLVIGKSEDGGAYLIGISKKKYKRETFLHFDWKKSSLVQSMNQKYSSIFFLEELKDIDNQEDFLAISKRNYHLFFSVFLLLEKSHNTVKDVLQSIYINFITSFKSLRAPPSYVLA